MKVWVLTIDQVYDFDVCDLIVQVFAHRETAMKALREYALDDKERAEEHGWQIEEWEVGNGHLTSSYTSWEEGNYSGNHFNGLVQEVFIQ